MIYPLDSVIHLSNNPGLEYTDKNARSRYEKKQPRHNTRSPVLESPESSLYLESRSKISNLTITEQFYWHILNMYERGKFLKKLWCCVGGDYSKIIWFYQLSWQCELATVKRFESWRFESLPFVGANRGIVSCVSLRYRKMATEWISWMKSVRWYREN